MPFAEHDGARIHWSTLGQGEPLVMVMGLGCSSALWFRLAPRLARHWRVILLDNRGVGQTEVAHFVTHRMSSMVGDVSAVLDAARVDSAHLLGFSMGGMIAQQFTLDHPERVRTLTLMATNCGGPHVVLAEPHVRALLFSKGEYAPEEALQAMRPYTYAHDTPQAVIDEDFLVRLANYPTARGYQAQLNGLLSWTSYSRLPRIDCPALVLHGSEDRLIPPANARILAQRIRGARVLEIERASHWLHSDQRDTVEAAIREFLHQHPNPP